MRIHTLFLAASIFASSANAADDAACKAGVICASKPQSVVEAMQSAGFRAKLDKDKEGDPLITSEASGYDFEVYFYGCEKSVNCSSIRFQTTFKAEPDNTPEYANAWNAKKRFIQASVEDQMLTLAYDLTTVGGVNAQNFEEVAGWWSDMLGDFAVFVKEQDAAAKKK
jgi:hypothetical protein